MRPEWEKKKGTSEGRVREWSTYIFSSLSFSSARGTYYLASRSNRDDGGGGGGGSGSPLMHDAASKGARVAPCTLHPAHVLDWVRCVATQ